MRTRRIDRRWTACALTLAATGCGSDSRMEQGTSTRAQSISSQTEARLPTGEGALPAPGGEFDRGFYVPINDLLLGRSRGAQVIANGNVAVSWGDPHVAATLDDEQALDEFDSVVLSE